MRTLNILIAEDDEQNQAILKLILGRKGHKIKSAWNGRIAFDSFKSGQFDLIFMDVHMPEMDGLETIRQIRQWEKDKNHTPIVLLTGSVPADIAENYKNVGADTYLFKPFDVNRINLLVEMIARESEPILKNEGAHASLFLDKNLSLLDIEGSLFRFNNNLQFYMENLSEFIHSLPGRQESMEIFLKDNNWKELSIYSHNLKGVAANFGAYQLSQLVSNLEQDDQDQNFQSSEKDLALIKENINKLSNYVNKIIEQQNQKAS